MFNGPTLSTCMILDTAGNLQTNSLQPLNNSASYNLLNNHSTSASIILVVYYQILMYLEILILIH